MIFILQLIYDKIKGLNLGFFRYVQSMFLVYCFLQCSRKSIGYGLKIVVF